MLSTVLRSIAQEFSPAVLASSLSAEDMVLTHAIASAGLPIGIFVLDTGRLNAETLNLISEVRRRYGIDVQVFHPEKKSVDEYIAKHGRDAFYGSVELRKACCGIRKVEPLRRALAGRAAWVTGLRREQSVTRTAVEVLELDAAHGGIAKLNPLAAWTEAQVWSYAREQDLPVNALHARGYPSIGCAPCTRAIAPGEDARAGRWWWESAEHKECGLHLGGGR